MSFLKEKDYTLITGSESSLITDSTGEEAIPTARPRVRSKGLLACACFSPSVICSESLAAIQARSGPRLIIFVPFPLEYILLTLYVERKQLPTTYQLAWTLTPDRRMRPTGARMKHWPMSTGKALIPARSWWLCHIGIRISMV